MAALTWGVAGRQPDPAPERPSYPEAVSTPRYPVAVVAYRIEDYVQLVIYFPLLFMKIFALADAIYRKDAFYVAADKQNKAFWIVLLAVFLVLQIFLHSPLQLLNLIGTVVAGVYLADVRPTLRAMRHY